MGKKAVKITRADGVTQGYHVGTAATPPTANDLTTTPMPQPTPHETYPDGASREVLNAWMQRQQENREADRLAHNAWRTATYPADVRGTGLNYPFTPESPIIRVGAVSTGVTYFYPATAFKEGTDEAKLISSEYQKAVDELVESGLAEVDEQGVWRVNACESQEAGYNHTVKVLKEEYDSLPPLHKFVIAHATDSFGSSLTGRRFYVSGND